MLRALIAWSLQQAHVVILAALMVVACGLWVLPRMPVDVFPELNAPTVTILTESGGLSADEVEQFVTYPIETAVSGLPGLRRVRSGSATSLSLVWVEFDWGVDVYRARQLVSERLALIREELPEQAHAEIGPLTSITGEIMLLSLVPDAASTVDALELRALAEFNVSRRLLAVPGISKVVSIGGELPEFQVRYSQDRLQLHDVTPGELADALALAQNTKPSGYLTDVQGMELPIRAGGRIVSAADIASTVVSVADDGAVTTIGQVADVELVGAPKRGTAADGGRPAVVLSVQKAPDANTLLLTDAVDAALDGLEPALAEQGVLLNRQVMRQSTFIERAVSGVLTVLRDAVIFVAIVIILFLLDVRATCITLTALPLSLAVALLALWAWGLSINVMTLGGLAVAIGELVDDAIIDVENVIRRLRENAKLAAEKRRSLMRVIFDASNEIRSSVVFATVLIVIVFMPLLFLGGLEGRFFQPLGVAYIVAIMASLLVALTVTPALCRFLLRGRLGVERPDAWLVRLLKRLYAPTLAWCLGHRRLVVFSSLLLVVASLLAVSRFGTSFLPRFNEGTYTVFLMAPPGTSLQESDRLARGVEQRLVAIEGVQSVSRRTGRAERDEHAEPPSSSEIEVVVQDGGDAKAIRQEIDHILDQIPGITTMVGQPIEHRLSHMLSGTRAAIAVDLYGDDLAELRALAPQLETALQALPGTRDVAANREVMITTVPVHFRRQELALLGLSPGEAGEQLHRALYGQKIDVINQGVRRYDLVLRQAENERQTPADLRQLVLHNRSGAMIRLHEVADVGREQASNLISRQDGHRKLTVSCNIADGHNLGHVVAAVRQAVAPLLEGSGVHVVLGGQFEAQQSAGKTLLIAGSIVVIVMIMLLHTVLGGLRPALLVMVNLPLGLIGGVVAIFLAESDHPLDNFMALMGMGAFQAPVVSIASLVGFITLFGIAVRNGILLVNHYRWLREQEHCDLETAVSRGSLERLVPILMTALTAVLGLVPLALAAGQPGSELLAPLAIVVLGGLCSSTLLNLLVVPAGYLLFCRHLPDARSRERLLQAASTTGGDGASLSSH